MPNPATDLVRILLPDGATGRSSVRCLDAVGREVFHENWNGTAPLNTAALSNGLYFLHVVDEQGDVIGQGRLVVQH